MVIHWQQKIQRCGVDPTGTGSQSAGLSALLLLTCCLCLLWLPGFRLIEIVEDMRLNEIHDREWRIFSCSAKHSEGLEDAFLWGISKLNEAVTADGGNRNARNNGR